MEGAHPAQRAKRAGVGGASCFPNKPYALQVIDTVPLGEVADDMFDYFEPLYRLIPDMPRPPETLMKRVTGQAPRMETLQVLRDLS